MSIIQRTRKTLQKILFGDTLVPQEFFLGLPDPQPEVSVWLHGMGVPVEVTFRHSMACAAPFTICISLDGESSFSKEDLSRLSLVFCERYGHKLPLGEIALKSPATMISAGKSTLAFFEARDSKNWCLSNTRLLTHYLYHAYSERRAVDLSGMKMTFLEKRAAMVMFIRPHPVSLVSLVAEAGGNIFPMNIMGDLGDGYVGFALKDCRRAAHLVEGVGRVAVSSLPLSQSHLAYKLAINHTKDSIDWEQLPFRTMASSSFHIPVPVFAQRVRELEVERVHPIGSHTFFVARTVSDEVRSREPGLCVIHGFYQARRLQGKSAELNISLAQDAVNKRGV
jgi:flavin reductase (DIM6/NTAB) family NADH-FMN oxidoreductase RutF